MSYLTREQLQANINALEQQGASQVEIQSYLDAQKTPGNTLKGMAAQDVSGYGHKGAGSFIAKDVLGVQPASQGFFGSLFQNTLGSRGAAGVGQDIGKASVNRVAMNETKKISQARSDLTSSADFFLELAKNEKNPTRKEKFLKQANDIIKTNASLGEQQVQIAEDFQRVNPLGTAGKVINAGSTLIGTGGATQVLKSTTGGLIRQSAVQGGKSGATVGAMSGLAGGLIDQKSFGQTATDTVVGGAFGGAVGAATGATLAALGAGVSKTRELFDRTKQKEKLVKVYEDTLRPTAKMQAIEAKYGKDTPRFLAEEGIQLQGKGGKLDPTDAIDLLEKKAQAENQLLSNLLKSEGKAISLEEYRRASLKALDTPFNRAKGELPKMQAKVNEEIDTLIGLYKRSGYTNKAGDVIVPLEEFNQIKSGRWAKAKGFASADDKIFNDVNFQMGHVAKEMIEGSSKRDIIRALNQRIGNFYSAIDLLGKRRGAVIAGGKFSRLTARLVGATVGSSGGPVGSTVGAITADKLVRIMQDPRYTTSFARKILEEARKKTPEVVRQAEELLQMNIDEALSRKLLQGPTPLGSKGNPFIMGAPTSFEKGVSANSYAPSPYANQKALPAPRFIPLGPKTDPSGATRIVPSKKK